jgi:hypothetical protein
MPATKTRIVRRNTEAAVKAVCDRYITAGIMSRFGVEMVSAAAIPLAADSIKTLRQRGYTPAEVTACLAQKIADAEMPGKKLAAEIFAAAWEGMQADYRETYGRDIAA